LAVGDALGTTVEFRPPGTFTQVKDIVGGGAYSLKAGQWTDDTSMALCLAESLIKCKGFDPMDQLRRYVRWYRHGYLSSTGEPFSAGNVVQIALQCFEKKPQPYCGPDDEWTAGNGSLMRLAPVALFYAGCPKDAIEKSGESSRTTHQVREAVDACRYFGGLICGVANGAEKEALLSAHYSPIPNYWEANEICPKISNVAEGSFKRKEPPEIKGSGYVVESLEAALWAFYKSSSFREGCLMAVNLGDDADTTGAVYGQLAGAYYGIEGIPEEWLQKLHNRPLIQRYAERIFAISNKGFIET
jgi:ADP-ribosyl-[dinitrogen reductase] hydrolase